VYFIIRELMIYKNVDAPEATTVGVGPSHRAIRSSYFAFVKGVGC